MAPSIEALGRVTGEIIPRKGQIFILHQKGAETLNRQLGRETYKDGDRMYHPGYQDDKGSTWLELLSDRRYGIRVDNDADLFEGTVV